MVNFDIQGVFFKSCKSKNQPKPHFWTKSPAFGLYPLKISGAKRQNTFELVFTCILSAKVAERAKLKIDFCKFEVISRNTVNLGICT